MSAERLAEERRALLPPVLLSSLASNTLVKRLSTLLRSDGLELTSQREKREKEIRENEKRRDEGQAEG